MNTVSKKTLLNFFLPGGGHVLFRWWGFSCDVNLPPKLEKRILDFSILASLHSLTTMSHGNITVPFLAMGRRYEVGFFVFCKIQISSLLHQPNIDLKSLLLFVEAYFTVQVK